MKTTDKTPSPNLAPLSEAPTPDNEPIPGLSHQEFLKHQEEHLSTCPPIDIPRQAIDNIYATQIQPKRAEAHNPFGNRHITPPYKRLVQQNVPYIGTYEEYRYRNFDTWNHIDKGDDHIVLGQLIEGQPHRIPAALNLNQPLATETYGPIMLPESLDPLSHISQSMPPEHPPAPWSPDATTPEMFHGNLRDILQCISLYTARIKVAAGHRPDSDSIHLLHKLSLTLKNIADLDTTLLKRKNAGRPRGTRPPITVKIAQLQLEKREKTKKYIPRKKSNVTPAKSEPEVQKNPPSPDFPKSNNINPEGLKKY